MSSLAHLLRVLCLFALTSIPFVANAAGFAMAQSLLLAPALSGHVVDTAGSLNLGEHKSIDSRLIALEKRTGAQVVVLMVPSTAPEDMASFANRVASAWKIGRKQAGDGVLVVVATSDRKMRIEVAKSLEGAIPDLAAARIIDEGMKPHFQTGDYAGGLIAAIDRLELLIAGEALPAPPSGLSPVDSDNTRDLPDGIAFAFFGVLVLGSVARRLFGRRFGSVLTGAGTGVAVYLLTASLLLAAFAALGGLFYVLLASSSGSWGGGSRGQSGGFGGGGLGGSLGGGGFSSGGGGDFGGGGASGSW